MKKITNDNYEEFIASKTIIVIHYDAIWSNYKQLRSKLFAIEDEEKKILDIDFGELDVTECPKIAQQLDVQNVPGIAYFFKGILVNSIIGIQQDPEEVITNICRAAFHLDKLAKESLEKTEPNSN